MTALKVAPPLRQLSLAELLREVDAGRAIIIDGSMIPRLEGGSIVASDLVLYNSANMPTSDTGTAGGAIDPLRRPDFTQLASAATVRVRSSSSGDTTQTATVTGRKSDGTLASETLSLNGTSNVTSSNTYERILKLELSATCAGTITFETSGAVAIRTIPIGERGFGACFQQIASDPSSGVTRYAKLFWKNTNGTLALTSAVVKENADPSAVITHALAASLDDSGSVADRTTDPGLTFNGSDKTVPNSQNLSSGSAIGLWLKLTLAAANAALKTTYTSELDGQTV